MPMECKYCGSVDWYIYSPSYSHSAAVFAHSCGRMGTTLFRNASTPEEHAAGAASRAASQANAAAYRRGGSD